MEHEGFVDRRDNVYTLGWEFLRLGRRADLTAGIAARIRPGLEACPTAQRVHCLHPGKGRPRLLHHRRSSFLPGPQRFLHPPALPTARHRLRKNHPRRTAGRPRQQRSCPPNSRPTREKPSRTGTNCYRNCTPCANSPTQCSTTNSRKDCSPSPYPAEAQTANSSASSAQPAPNSA